MKFSSTPSRMRGFLVFLCLVAVVAFAGWACVEDGQAQTGGSLANPSFESWSNNMPTGWVQESNIRDRGSVSSDSDSSEGSRSLKLSPNSRNSNASQPYGVAQEILAGDWAGTQVEAAVSMRASGGAKGALFILFRSSGGQIVGTKLLAQENDSNSFEERTALIDVPSNVSSLIVACITTSRSGEVWFDNVRIGSPGETTSTPEATAAGGNVVLAETFEQWSDGLPSGWVQEGNMANRGQVRRDISRANSGQAALRLAPNSGNTNSNEPYGVARIERAEHLGGRSLRVEAYLRREGEAVAGVLFLARDDGGAVLQSTLISLDSGSGDYVLRTGQINIPGNVRDFILALVVVGTSGQVWFDDVRLVEGGAAPPGAAGGGSPVDIGRSARISVDAGDVIRAIPQNLYGYNLGWVWYGEGVWDAEHDDFNQPVVESLAALNPAVIRFPQGSYADFYHWKDGVGPRRNRPVRAHGTDDNRSKMLFGTDEFMELCRRVGAQPMMQVNIITGTPQEAADWVAYANRVDSQTRINNGHPEPYNIKLWEIGNEQYMKTDSPRLKQTELSPSQYVTKFRQFVAAMKAVDPTIQVGAVGNKDFHRYQLGRGDNWNEHVLQEIGPEIDFFAVHNSYAPAFASQSGATLKEIYAALVAFPEQIAGNLADVSAQIRQYAGDHADDVEIAVTEWGPLFHVVPSDPYVDHPKTLGSALFVAVVLQKYIESDMTGIANFFKATEHAFMSAVGNNGAIKPAGYVLGMYANNFGKRLVRSTVESSTFATRTVGNIEAVPNAPYVSAVSALSEDGSRLYIMAVNKDFDGSRPLEIHLEGFEPQSNAKIVTLTGPALDANNGDDLPQVEGIVWGPQARAPNSAWDEGKPGFVSPKESSIGGAGTDFSVDLPPMSVVSIELTRR